MNIQPKRNIKRQIGKKIMVLYGPRKESVCGRLVEVEKESCRMQVSLFPMPGNYLRQMPLKNIANFILIVE